MGLIFNPLSGMFDFTGSGGGGGGTISGTIAATQVPFGTGADTIGGSANLTWNGTDVAFTAAHGLAFAGTRQPTTVRGGDDGSGNSAVILDNADPYIAVVFNQYTDLIGSDVLEITSPDFLTQIGIDPSAGVNLTVTTGQFIRCNGPVLAADFIAGLSGGSSSLTLKPAYNLDNQWLLASFIHSGDTDRNVIHSQQYAIRDATTHQFESGAYYGGFDGTNYQTIFGIGAEGHFHSGVLADYQYYLYDEVLGQTVFAVTSTFPHAVQFGSGFSISVPATVTANLFSGSGASITFPGTLSIASGKTATVSNTLTFTGTDTSSVAFGAGGTVLYTSGSGTSLTFPGTLSIASGKILTASNTLTLTGTDSSAIAFGTGGTVLYNGGALGTPASGTLSSCSGLPISSGVSGLGSGIAAFLATPSSANLATALTDETGSGKAVFDTTPTLVTPVLGVATATTINKITLTAPATGSTLTIADGKVATVSNTLTFTGTDTSSVAFGAGGTVQYKGVTKRLSVLQFATLPDTSGNVWLEPAALTQTNDLYPQMVVRYKDTATKDTLGIRFPVPTDYVAGAKMYFLCTSTATTGNFVMTLDYVSAGTTATLDPSASEESLTVTQAAPGSSQTGVLPTVTLTAANLAANDVFQGIVGRNGASGSDTMTADLIVYDVIFEYTN